MNTQTKTEEKFCIDDLMSELHAYVKEELQKAGKPEIETQFCRYYENQTCLIQTDRERLRQILALLLDNAVRYIERGFIAFGYFVLKTDMIDFHVDDTRVNNINENLTEVSALVQQMGSRLKTKAPKDKRSSCSFTVKCKTELLMTLPPS